VVAVFVVAVFVVAVLVVAVFEVAAPFPGWPATVSLLTLRQ
jgi:hypothetical protein